MAWLRIDDGFTANAKIAELTDGEFRLWVRLLCYCAKGRDPTVDKATRKEVAGLTPTKVQRFASLKLLDQVGSDYEIHDWLVYLPKDLTNAERQARWRARKRHREALQEALRQPLQEAL